MNRMVIIGSSGSGKSSLAREVSRMTGVPVIHLDLMFWRADWKPAPVGEARERFTKVLRGEAWIVEGDFLHGQSGPEGDRFERADTIVFLDLPRILCLWRVLIRIMKDRGRPRPDLPTGCCEGFDSGLVSWIWSYPSTERPNVLRVVNRYRAARTVHHLRSRSDVRSFLSAFETTSRRGSEA